MAKGVVGLLEMIEIEVEQRKLMTPALAPGDFRVDERIEEKSIGQTRKRVATGHLRAWVQQDRRGTP